MMAPSTKAFNWGLDTPTWTTIGELADLIESYVRQYDWVTFAELGRRIPGLDGDRELVIADTNIVLWAGMSPEFCDALAILRVQRRVFPWGSCVLAYYIDGRSLRLPVAKRVPKGGYRSRRWAPICFRSIPYQPAPKGRRTAK